MMRSLSLCVIWLIFALLALVVAIFPPPSSATIVLGLAALYGAQAFIAEASASKSIKPRFHSHADRSPISPCWCFGASESESTDIDQITSRSAKQIRLHKSSGERVRLTFANRAAKSQFVDCIKQTNPSIDVYR